MTDTITLPREVVEGALEALDSEHPDIQLRAAIALRKALAAEQPKPEPVAVFDEQMGHPVLLLGSPMLKDKQPLYTAPPALAAEQPKPITVPKTVPLPPITCGFVDVRFDGEGWFCDKCGKRMSADFETSVKRVSEKCYLELMQWKAEAVRTMNERNMK